VLFVIDLASRRVQIGGITTLPHGPRMAQVARELSGFDGFLNGKSYLLLDSGRLKCARHGGSCCSLDMSPRWYEPLGMQPL
jgi:hypothetical protein